MRSKPTPYNFKFNSGNSNFIYKDISHIIARDIEKGILQKNFQLPSINEFSNKYSVGRDTVEKAYKDLKKQAYIKSFPGKGCFVVGKKGTKLKVLLIFNKLSSYKKIVYDSLVKTLGKKAQVDLQIHHYDPKILREIIENNFGLYNHYVIMPHFFQHAKEKEYLPVLNIIPSDELVLLDKTIDNVPHSMAVFQNFKYDIFHALVSTREQVQKYQNIKMIFPEATHHPQEIIEGVTEYCNEAGQSFSIVPCVENEKIKSGTLYIVIEDTDLALLIKKVRQTKFQLGKQIGVISFNETVLKELLDITVITTDFQQMGESLGNMILKKQHAQIKNPFKIIVRNSL